VAADFTEPLGPGSTASVLAGRFQMNLGSRRLFASDDYRNTGNSVGGVRSDLKLSSGWSGTAWYVLPDLRVPDDVASMRSNDTRLDQESPHFVTWGALATSPRRVAGGAVDVLFMKLRESDAPRRPTRDRNLDTGSLRWYRNPAAGQLDYEIELVRQWGRARTGTAVAAPLRDVEAAYEHIQVGYRWDAAWKPRLVAEFDRATGDRGSDKIRRFDTLLGGRRFDLAPSGLYNQVSRTNLLSPGLRIELNPDARLDVMGTWKLMRLESPTDSFSGTGVRDVSGRSGDFAGHQLDFRARYWLVPNHWRAEIDTLFLLKGRFLEQAPNARPGDTKFVSLNLTWIL
ncbi:MAG: alginate export family protein, partial [Steroidobacteraceae bacterium]